MVEVIIITLFSVWDVEKDRFQKYFLCFLGELLLFKDNILIFVTKFRSSQKLKTLPDNSKPNYLHNTVFENCLTYFSNIQTLLY